MLNFTFFILCTMFIMCSMFFSKFSFRVRAVKLEDCPEEVKDQYFLKHPGVKWCFHTVEAFKKITNVYNNFTEFVSQQIDENSYKCLECEMLLIEMIFALESLSSITTTALTEYNKISQLRINLMVRMYGFNKTTEKLLGKYTDRIAFLLEKLDTVKYQYESEKSRLGLC